MKKGLILVTTLCLSWLLLAAQVNIVGTWVGETEIPDFEDPDKITMVIKEADGKFTGTATDTFGMMQDAECENIELEGTKLTMNLEIVNPDGEYIRVWATLTVEGDTMKGYWQSEDDNMNSIELKRQ
jgi:hypothetical protein